jgi:hypothetical protein
MKPGNQEAKVQWVKDMLAKGYKVWNYCEHYTSARSDEWSKKVKENIDTSTFMPITNPNAQDWFYCEDFLLTLDATF